MPGEATILIFDVRKGKTPLTAATHRGNRDHFVVVRAIDLQIDEGMTMEAFRTEKTVEKGGKLTVEGLPFREGDEVEVTVRPRKQAPKRDGLYPLRGSVIQYTDPFESVAEEDWEALK